MFNFKTVSIGAAILLVLFIFLYYIDVLNPVWIFAVLLLHFLCVIWGSFWVQSNFYTKVHCQFVSNKKEVVLTFDDGPHGQITPQVLDILKKWNVKATFFCIGHQINQNAHIIRRAQEEGHTLGLHSFSHSYYYDFYLKRRLIDDLQMNQDVFMESGGIRPRLFRPPYGVTTPYINQAVRHLGLKVVGWSVRSLDTIIRDEKKVVDRIMKRVTPGAIILLHDHLPSTPRVLNRLLEKLKDDAYEIVDIEHALGINQNE